MRATQTALRKFFNGIETFEGLGLDAAKRDFSWDLHKMSFDELMSLNFLVIQYALAFALFCSVIAFFSISRFLKERALAIS
jgi:hypothetical protein